MNKYYENNASCYRRHTNSHYFSYCCYWCYYCDIYGLYNVYSRYCCHNDGMMSECGCHRSHGSRSHQKNHHNQKRNRDWKVNY